MIDAFYRREGELFVSTPATTGPWSIAAQHAGPPSALLARAAEMRGVELDVPHLARLTVQILRPVPIASLGVEVEVDTRGRSAARLSLRLRTDDHEVMRATALLLRSRPIDVVAPEPEPAPALEDARPFDFPFFHTPVGYHTAMECRLARGEFGHSPTFMWLRSRVPLVEGEELAGAQRAVLAADSGNGVSPVLDWTRHGFINPDLTVALHRPSEGEWIGLDARTDVSPSLGVGTAHSRIYDRRGAIGYGLQSLICDPF